MAGEKITQHAGPGVQGLQSDPLAKTSDKDMALKKDVMAGESAPPVSFFGDISSGIKGDQVSAADQSIYYTPASCYNYYYSAYGGAFNQPDDQSHFSAGGGSYTGIQPDNSSLLYYLPGYNPYAVGYMGVDGEQPYVSSGYLQQPVSYGSETFPAHSWDSKCVGDATNKVVNKSDSLKPMGGRNGSTKLNSFNSSKTNNPLSNEASNVPLNAKTRQSTVPSKFSKSFDAQALRSFNKFGSGLHSVENFHGFYNAGKFSSYGNQNQGAFMHYPMNYHPNARIWNGNQRFKLRQNFRREGENEELTRGPRANTKGDASKLSGEHEQREQMIQRDKYNLEGFQSEYENAKFYVIKSYSEDDVHKCVKYDVWSSTPNGNRKLDDAFHVAETKATEVGSKYPVFLFFSVNGSGQFVGVAEMIGRVDFNKNMDFWQLDKWNGFFPVKWHIVKDIPNNLLRHIILENNDNRSVTYSRDTQEIGLKQGLEMLKIFKSYSAKTSLLDDFDFYENRETLLKANRSCKQDPNFNVYEHCKVAKDSQGGEKAEENSKTDDVPSIVALTENLSLDSQPIQGPDAK